MYVPVPLIHQVGDVLKGIDEEIDSAKQTYDGTMLLLENKKRLLKAGIMERLKIEEYEEVTLHLMEYRDDEILCYQPEQKINCWVKEIDISLSDGEYKYLDAYFYPVLLLKANTRNWKKTPLRYNSNLSWRLFRKNGNLIIDNVNESIIKEKYTKDRLERMRMRSLNPVKQSAQWQEKSLK